MKLETIKKDKRKKIIIGSMVVLSVVGCLTLTTTRAKYRSVQSIKLASGTIKINSYDFKIMAMKQSEDGVNYTDITTMPESGYIINEEKSYCTTDNKTQVKGKLKTNSDGEHIFSKLNKNDKCYIWFDKYVPPITIDNIIASLEAKSANPNFSQAATEDEGVYATNDGMYGGTTYYWRGATTTNYVKLAKWCWRIIRINGDKTMRLIYDGTTCHANGEATEDSIAFESIYNNGDKGPVGWTYDGTSQRTLNGTDSNAKIQTENWYNSNLLTYDSRIAEGKFCNDRNAQSGDTWSSSNAFGYAALWRVKNKAPSFNCFSGDIYKLKVGLITLDEVVYAGGGEFANRSFYLYNGKNYFTLSPNRCSEYFSYIFYVNYVGYLTEMYVAQSQGFRPVINLRSDVTFNAGSDGTKNNPYVVQ